MKGRATDDLPQCFRNKKVAAGDLSLKLNRHDERCNNTQRDTAAKAELLYSGRNAGVKTNTRDVSFI